MFKDFCEACGPAILTLSIVVFLFIVGAVYWYYKKKPVKAKPLLPVSVPDTNTRKDSVGEKECRRVLEEYFGKQFPKCRPEFLRNQVTSTEISNYNLELDCYNDELKLGVEYNGRQHYSYVPHFHKNREAFYNQKYRDELKRIKCREHGVHLIEVPYTIPVDKIRDYILETLKSIGVISQK
jgi:hypothetical protein